MSLRRNQAVSSVDCIKLYQTLLRIINPAIRKTSHVYQEYPSGTITC